MLLEYLEKVIDSTTVEDVWTHHLQAMNEFGFARLFYGFTRFKTARSFGDKDDILILTNHDPAYLEQFIDGGLYSHAPMVNWAAQNVGACSWSWIHSSLDQMTDSERRVLELNIKFGITAGYTISFKDVSIRAKGAIGLVGEPSMTQADVDAIWAEHGRTILQMNNVAHLKLASLPYQPRNRRLTARQREVLEWVGDGKTISDIATIMGVTQATVEKHMRNAREALDVDTTAQAVLKASFSNQIFHI